MMNIPGEVIGVGVTVGLAGAGIIGGMLRWSILRNIEKLDESMNELKAQVSSLASSLAQVREEGVTASECSMCRRECNERSNIYQQDILGWLRRSDDKADRMMMMIANLNNGQGGVK
jgi:formate dehydrogenase assembly factor FdhD